MAIAFASTATTKKPAKASDSKASDATTPKKTRKKPKREAEAATAVGKKAISIRLDEDILDHFRAAGSGWQGRINTALRGVISKK